MKLKVKLLILHYAFTFTDIDDIFLALFYSDFFFFLLKVVIYIMVVYNAGFEKGHRFIIFFQGKTDNALAVFWNFGNRVGIGGRS